MQGRLSLDEWLAMRENHFPDYVQRMERIHSDWMLAVSSRKNMLTRRTRRSRTSLHEFDVQSRCIASDCIQEMRR